jgi:hypothetical protein
LRSREIADRLEPDANDMVIESLDTEASGPGFSDDDRYG